MTDPVYYITEKLNIDEEKDITNEVICLLQENSKKTKRKPRKEEIQAEINYIKRRSSTKYRNGKILLFEKEKQIRFYNIWGNQWVDYMVSDIIKQMKTRNQYSDMAIYKW